MSTKGHGAWRYVGTNAERVALATGGLVAGVLFIETDTLDIYTWDGTAWQTGGGAPINAQYVTLALDATLTDERVLTAGTGIILTDAGAGNTITVAVDETLYLRLDTTNDPLTAGLEINAATADEPVLILQTTDNDATNPFLEMQKANGVVLHFIGQSAIQFQPAVDSTTFLQVLDANGGTPILNIDATNERVGIRTNNPQSPLHVSLGVSGAIPQPNSIGTFENDDNCFFQFMTPNDEPAGFFFGDPQDGNVGSIHYDHSDNSIAFHTTAREQVRIDSLGRVGINETVVGAQLQVNTRNTATIGQIIKGAAAQAANLFELQESDGSIMLSSGDGLGGSVFAGNVQLEDIDFVWAGDTEANLFRVDAGADEVRMGDWDTNYSAFEVDGTLRFEGTAAVWDDLYYPMSSGKIGGANQPTWAAFQGNTFEYTFAINDYIHLPSGEVIHKYLEGSDITLHVHIVLDGSDAGNTYVNYEIEYTIGDAGEVMAGAAVVTSGDTLIAGGTADRTHISIAIDTIAGAGYKIEAALKMRFRRIALVGGGLNAPSNDPFVMMVGAHIEEDTVGSRTAAAK